jgi:hypothetical protein
MEREETTAAAQADTDEPTGKSEVMTVTGCLSSADGRYVLTELEGNNGTRGGTVQPTTETYQLTNADEKLRDHVGKQVRINGEAEPARIAELRETTPGTASVATGTAGQQSGNQPEVSTETRTRLEMRRMSVMYVMPTGADCPAGTASGSGR